MMRRFVPSLGVVLMLAAGVRAGVGDPQVGTDHPWYPGELACSTFERLFATQAAVYRRVTGEAPTTDEQKALASWLWRNTHYAHGEEGAEDWWGAGFGQGQDTRSREYWTGLFAHGFGLCGTTHSQWIAEMQRLLGHGRGRGVGVDGHSAFEVYLMGGPYGAGKWVLLDHDLSTVIFDRDGKRLLSIREIAADWKRFTDRGFLPRRQRGWLVCGLHPDDGAVYRALNSAEYLGGYAGPPPMVHLRRGETLRRYLRPGLEDGQTFVFWGRNYNTGGIPGPERAETWVNQPERMHGSTSGAGHRPGQARYGNAVYTYRPDFSSGDYREGIVAEDAKSVTFEFYTPYIIGATPADGSAWGIYQPGGRNGLVLRGRATGRVSLSIDQGRTWIDGGEFREGLDLTDQVKGRRQYWLRLEKPATQLVNADLTITTVCQANAAILPRLSDGGCEISFEASGRAIVSGGPNRPRARVVEGAFDSPRVTLELATPRGEAAVAVHAAAHVRSSNPPDPSIKYQIEYSTDGGRSWTPIVNDWSIPRRGDEPTDFWSQSFCWGEAELRGGPTKVRVRFRNDGGKPYARGEMHLIYRVPKQDSTRITFAWNDDGGDHRESLRFPATGGSRRVMTGRNVRTHWIELEPVW